MAHPLKFLFFNSRTSSSANAQEPFAWIAGSDKVMQRVFSLEEINLPSSTVLLSGGIDSSACLQFLLDRRHDVYALFIDYGQAAAERERLAAGAITENFDLHLSR
jgi:3'-phosphoadenosine 5'-phosphosulfate sulfotransferase (PAPS reductase)/FAD synthetase